MYNLGSTDDIENDNTSSTLVFLILSILWSFTTSAITAVKIKMESKNIFPIFPTLLLGVRYLMVSFVRISCLVSYYAPFLGLLDIMAHHHAEKIPLDSKTYENLKKTGTVPNMTLNVTKFWS